MSKLRVRLMPRFLKDLRACRRLAPANIRSESALEQLVESLINDGRLPKGLRSQALRGEFTGLMQAWLDGDWSVIYRVRADEVSFYRTGTQVQLSAGR